MTVAVQLRFDDSYARAVPQLSVPWTAAPVPHPALLALNEEVASELGADPAALREPAGLALLTGRAPEGPDSPWPTAVLDDWVKHSPLAKITFSGDG